MKRLAVIVLGLALLAGAGVLTWRATRPATRPVEPTPQPAAVVLRPPAVPTRPAPLPSRPAPETYRGVPGYWRLVDCPDGVWWFLSPSGNREFMNCVTTVQPFQLARDPNGVQFVSRDYDGGTTENGNLRAWATKTIARVRDAGFKGLGAWCNPEFHDLNVPMSQDLNLWKWVNGERNAHKIYDADWPSLIEAGVVAQVTKLRDNRALVGYYLDNELDWGDAMLGPRIYFDGYPPTDRNRVEVVKVIRELWPDIAAFNRDWGAGLTTWKDLDAWTSLPLTFASGSRAGNYAAYVRLLSAWMEHAAREYFRVTTSLVRRHDPNHLILGVRFKGWAPSEIVRASRGYTDAESLNYYVGDALLDREMFTMMNRDSGGQPVIITEYSFHALDGQSGNRNTVGFAGQVPDQRARAEGYRLFTTRLARVPYVIGADWFQWSDEPPSGRKFDGEDVNFGIVDVDDRPYDSLVATVRRVGPALNEIHAAAGPTGGAAAVADTAAFDGWRDSFVDKPLAAIPYLTTAPTINGELSDWPPEARIPNMRHSRTVGLERSRVPLPNVYAGWRQEGLYLAFEVFDDDIQGADPKGWWWTRDCVEWWIATRPIPPTQNWYDASCHQFFFVPQEFPSEGVSGTVGRWHRPGDGIADSIIPETRIKQVARVLPTRYVVEMFIPAAALNEWNPTAQPKLGFNIHVRNWQHAIDYYWSAPKEVQTQLRPNTWGTLFLAPKKLAAG
jgi:hypothetical protein